MENPSDLTAGWEKLSNQLSKKNCSYEYLAHLVGASGFKVYIYIRYAVARMKVRYDYDLVILECSAAQRGERSELRSVLGCKKQVLRLVFFCPSREDAPDADIADALEYVRIVKTQ